MFSGKKLPVQALVLLVALALLSGGEAARADERNALQTPGRLYRSYDFNWSRFSADQRSFRYEGVRGGINSGGFCQSSGIKTRTAWPAASPWTSGSQLRVDRPASQRTVSRVGYGRKSAYSYRERIISYNEYRTMHGLSRGSTIGRR
ncbi:MAG: hypothetical protein A3F83_07550 [Candidatus Glassbacteria bacterium RIFCSPLOWO2_12_FULL_58_11]|uniref:Uncharacterized protein n=1 Tax=Candidatus Glassbacteria bacterium RIFCSPLOWO2_12_FULL_58_11 TaxID=1817867 RepID=A0A1F5Z2K7_9BACT|nr:MAG: hypothetical protein A3F83_07550 [Candidatus Glassbacteria bacterium RIFCSPLOWO2_12_FULL_58_11]